MSIAKSEQKRSTQGATTRSKWCRTSVPAPIPLRCATSSARTEPDGSDPTGIKTGFSDFGIGAGAACQPVQATLHSQDRALIEISAASICIPSAVQTPGHMGGSQVGSRKPGLGPVDI